MRVQGFPFANSECISLPYSCIVLSVRYISGAKFKKRRKKKNCDHPGERVLLCLSNLQKDKGAEVTLSCSACNSILLSSLFSPLESLSMKNIMLLVLLFLIRHLSKLTRLNFSFLLIG